MADVNFTNAEAALISTLITNISHFTADNLKAGDYDSVFTYALENNDVYYFGWTEVAPGANLGSGIWQNTVSLAVGILFRGEDLGVEVGAQMEADIRVMIDAILAEMLPENRLGGAVESSRLLGFSEPTLWTVEDAGLSYVRLDFSISLEERMPFGC